jgi:hypothetical protein
MLEGGSIVINNPERRALRKHMNAAVKMSNALVWLSSLMAMLALVVVGTGLFWQDGGGPFSFTSLHGQTVQMYGQGLYRNDTLFSAGTFKGTDTVTLFVAIPLLMFSILRYHRGSLRGGLLLTGTLAYFLYNAASMAFGAAYNSLFLVYIAYFSTSLFAFVLAWTSIDLEALPDHISAGLPHRGIANFLIAGGLVLAFIWLSEIIGPLVEGQVPRGLGAYTTMFTHALDTAVITPVLILAGVLLLRRAALGYLLASTLLVLCTLVGIMVVAQTIAQSLVGVELSMGQFIGIVGSFVVMGLIASWLTVALLRHILDSAPVRAAREAPADRMAARSIHIIPADGRPR